MKAKTMIELLNLSSNLYLISKDKELLKNLSEWTEKGKKKWEEFTADADTPEEEEELLQKIIRKAGQAKEELEQKMEEVAMQVYQKMHIATTTQVNELREQINELQQKIVALQDQIKSIETKKNSAD